MLLEVIQNEKQNGFKRTDRDTKTDHFLRTVNSFFEASNREERMVYLLEAQVVKLSDMVQLSYYGQVSGTKDLPYPNEDVIDMMVSTVQSEFTHDYVRVITEAEKIVCKNLLANTSDNNIKEVSALVASLDAEDIQID